MMRVEEVQLDKKENSLWIRITVSLRPNTITRVCILQKYTRPTVFLGSFFFIIIMYIIRKRDQKNKIKRSACRTNTPPPQAELVGEGNYA